MKGKLYLWMLIGMFWIVNGGEVLSQEMDHLHSLAVDPQTGTLLMGTHHGLYESRDEGKSRQKRTLKGDVPGTDFMTMVADPANPKLTYAGGHDLAVLKSEDGAASWSRVDDGPENPNVTSLTSVPIPTGMGGIFLYAGTAAGLFRSADCF